VPGTDIGRALDEGYRAMEKNDRRKIMVLLTDGEDLEKSGIRTAQQLAEKRIVVFAVGVGTAAGSRSRWSTSRSAENRARFRGSVVQSRLDEATLRGIAEATHGSYEPLGPLGEGLTRVRRVGRDLDRIFRFIKAPQNGVDRFHIRWPWWGFC